MLTLDDVTKLLSYDPETGLFVWNERSPSEFLGGVRGAEWECARWNSRYAGKVAGNRSQYTSIKIRGTLYKAHRLAWLICHGEFPEDMIDHVNGDKHDNRICNLRKATRAENMFNRGEPKKKSAIGFKGVHFSKSAQCYIAVITYFKKRKFLGQFSTPEEAHEAYWQAAIKYHGEFANRGLQ